MKRLSEMLLVLALTACSAPSDEPKVDQERVGREETQTIRNTKEIGMSGDAMANRVDGALDASEKHAEEMKKAEEEANPQ